MSMGQLVDDLQRLAGTAPVGSPPPDLWRQGVRRARRRRGATGVAVLALVALVGVGGLVPDLTRSDQPPVAEVEDRHLPEQVIAPDPDAPGTDADGPVGALAAVSVARRSGEAEHLGGMNLPPEPGATTDRAEHWAVFGVSAVDGTARWVDLPVAVDERTCTVSPFGDLVGCLQVGPPKAQDDTPRHVGVLLHDATAGTTRLLDLPQPEMAETSQPTRPSVSFTRDGRFLTTSLTDGSGDESLWAFEVSSGRARELSGPPSGFAQAGDAPQGMVWFVRPLVTRPGRPADGVWASATGTDRTAMPLTRSLEELTVSPDATRVVALGGADASGSAEVLTAPWPLRAGTTWEVLTTVPMGAGLLGWLDATRILVPDPAESAPWAVLDVTTGELEGPFALAHADGVSAEAGVTYAVGLLGNDLVPAREPSTYLSSATKTRLGVGVGVLCLGGIAWWFRRRWRRA